MPSAIEVRKVPIHSVADASELATLIDDGVMAADRVVAIIGKTEGNGGVNDYTRIIADRAFREVLVEKGADAAKVKEIPIVWSGGTDGVISPHATIFATTDAEPSDESRLTVGFAMSEVLLPEDIGRTAMIEKVADAVKVAMERAGISDTADVHYVQTKTPLLTLSTIEDAKSRGETVFTEDTLYSMDVSNGGTALGIAVALGEIEMPTDEQVLADRSLYSSVASCSSGVELDRAQVVVVGNASGRGRPLPDRALGDEGRARPGRASGTRSASPGSICPSVRTPPTSRAGSSTCSSSARPRRTARCAVGATRCSTTPTCTGTARSRRPSAASPLRSPVTRRCSCPCRRPTRVPTVAAPWPRSSTWAEEAERAERGVRLRDRRPA